MIRFARVLIFERLLRAKVVHTCHPTTSDENSCSFRASQDYIVRKCLKPNNKGVRVHWADSTDLDINDGE